MGTTCRVGGAQQNCKSRIYPRHLALWNQKGTDAGPLLFAGMARSYSMARAYSKARSYIVLSR